MLDLVKLDHSGYVLGSTPFLILYQLPKEITLALKVVKSDLKIIILLH